ncbi:MAG: methylated-DNA-protein-cysteine methyltransferase, methylated-DNA-protein-cysteine methyltransferase related protein [Candidatus Gottesmanbacteria bacterium GW2011_GWA2_43_14]|uniref:Methylated-DNA-protein-cysteine methyltransferase, methylated-DNA-protein-cysteine methyltransferase related protein n=1 Tax=Candidatus Gottesmanbacteria bacterium GW2011_GWA2_43_14 TaxID=1618443 RepID=A0A0G1GHH5_9BACT|nr:MAG: methylated-DNA-protein-cysteine methyltransferase, methylated-DNA-protein-cysteine methyltransferase related protein [Candidatus Gottesmanbacteria bacterium GW2011_GWA2_43_14]
MENKDKVFILLKKIPVGKVTTYKALAKKAGLGNPRQVGKIIHGNNHPEIYPCHRVVKSDGTLASGYKFGGLAGQKKRLLSEGITFSKNKIDLSKNQFNFS